MNKNDKKKYIEYNLHNVNNYESTINYDELEVFNNYKLIISSYIKLISENNYFINKNNFKIIINKGIDTFSHIFKIILLYTKSLHLATYHSQKAYIFYIEFIEQMYQDNNAFLKLNFKDAILFLYKKTIYDLNDDYIKHKHKITTDENIFFCNLNIYIQSFNTFAHYVVINDTNKYIYNKVDLYYDYFDKLTHILQNNKNKYNNQILTIILSLINKLESCQVPINNILQILQLFVEYINEKSNLDINHLQNMIYITNFSSIIIQENIFNNLL